MKGIVFTMDALFALVIAAAGISVLLYVTYTAQAPAAIHYSDAEAILESLASTSISSVANSSWITQGIMAQYAGANETSPGFLGGPYANSGGVSGPTRPILDFAFNPQNTITTSVVAAYGNIYFAANNIIYSVNATTNKLTWSVNTITNVAKTPVLYSGMLFFANTTNLTAVSALTGARAWSTNSISSSGATLTSPILAYDNQLVFGMSDAYVHSYRTSNGTSYWSNYTGTNPVAIAIAGGDIAVVTSSGSLYIIVHAGNTAKQVYSKAFAVGNAPTKPVGSNFRLFFGSGSSANATYVNGTTAAGFPVGISQSVTDTAYYNGYAVYQTNGGDVAIVPSSTGSTTEWSYTAPGYFGSALTNATPVVTGSMIYTLWANGLAAQNVSTGNLEWFAGLQGTISPYMALAYGRLYVVASNEVLAYGSCFAPQQATLLSAISTMYTNSQAGCGMTLLNSLYPNGNYSFFAGRPSTNTVQAASFNGASSYVEAASSTSLNSPSTALTISAWIKTNAANVQQGIVGKWEWSLGNLRQYYLQVYSDNKIDFFLSPDGSSTSQVELISTNQISPSTWYNVVGVYNGNNMKIYIDGSLSNSIPYSSGIFSGTGKFAIGIQDPSSPVSYFNGMISDVQVYNTALSPSQVQQLYAKGAQGTPPANDSIISWWPLNGGANDYSGTNPGFAVGGVEYATSTYTLPAFAGSYVVSKASIPLPVLNYTTGVSNIISVGVYSWS